MGFVGGGQAVKIYGRCTRVRTAKGHVGERCTDHAGHIGPHTWGGRQLGPLPSTKRKAPAKRKR
jgi:hypothetical protein